MILVHDPDGDRVIDIETGNSFCNMLALDPPYINCWFIGNEEPVRLHGDTAKALWAWLVKASLQFPPIESGHGIWMLLHRKER